MHIRLTPPSSAGGLLLRGALLLCVSLPVQVTLAQDTTPSQPSQDSAPQVSVTAPQTPSVPNSSSAGGDQAPELTTGETEATFRVRVNLVEVRVVVRDAKGNVVRDLTKDDFQLLDNGKPQVITRFAVEESSAQPSPQAKSKTSTVENPAVNGPATVTTLPQRYVAYLFDDVHLPFGALANARIAAERQIQALLPNEHVAIYTTSAQTTLEFTDDRSALSDALKRLSPRPGASSVRTECPHMTYYMADRIENRGDTQALDAATLDALDCTFQGDVKFASAAENMARSAARSALHGGDFDSRSALDALRRVVQRLAPLAGRRTIVLVSPGFLNINELQDQSRIVERALHSGVVIDTLDARGLYTQGDDASQGTPARHPGLLWKSVDSYTVDSVYHRYTELQKTAQADVLRGLAEDTGGTFFNNSNDLGAGFAAATPEIAYLLAFSVPKVNLDGSFHNLKISVKGQGYSVQARKGYYAPKQANDESAEARRELEEAVFSQQESKEIPVQLNTEFFKLNDEQAKLTVLVRVDARNLHFRKLDGRNCNDVTVVSALFDRNGKFVSGSEKVLQMRLKDETLGSRLISGLPLKTSFDVKPGSYLVRLVVRDDGGRLTAQNDAVDIP